MFSRFMLLATALSCSCGGASARLDEPDPPARAMPSIRVKGYVLSFPMLRASAEADGVNLDGRWRYHHVVPDIVDGFSDLLTVTVDRVEEDGDDRVAETMSFQFQERDMLTTPEAIAQSLRPDCEKLSGKGAKVSNVWTDATGIAGFDQVVWRDERWQGSRVVVRCFQDTLVCVIASVTRFDAAAGDFQERWTKEWDRSVRVFDRAVSKLYVVHSP